MKRRQLVIAILATGRSAAPCSPRSRSSPRGGRGGRARLFGALCLASAIGFVRIDRSTPTCANWPAASRKKHPDLRAALLAAMDQKPGPTAA